MTFQALHSNLVFPLEENNFAMPISREITCPHCNAVLEIQEEDGAPQELQIDCPACDQAFTVPPCETPKRERKKLGLKKDSEEPALPDGDRPAGGFCPSCGASIQDLEAVICVDCGTHLTTGKKKAGRPAPRTTRRKVVGGVIGVVCIIAIAVSVYSIVAGERKIKSTRESEQLQILINSSERSHNVAASIESLELGLGKYPLATNRVAAETRLARLREELPRVPQLTLALAAVIKKANAEEREVAIRLLNEGLEKYHGAKNTHEAIVLRDRL